MKNYCNIKLETKNLKMSANINGTSFKILRSLLPQYNSHTYYCYANLLDTSSNKVDVSRKWNAAGNHSYACILFKAIILLKIRLQSTTLRLQITWLELQFLEPETFSTVVTQVSSSSLQEPSILLHFRQTLTKTVAVQPTWHFWSTSLSVPQKTNPVNNITVLYFHIFILIITKTPYRA